ncbi:hypothetical protein F511_41925 [Dorcoceras hygrometricum]|uniref:Uncharacterized protein n=1 Tax=Dorcoceras hygrometricum TaxID=472368 RepID=A0A2Z7BQ61_9LAMI|nr:hypothetical protein F511_41925 [Dorcoceras hygrometricum]
MAQYQILARKPLGPSGTGPKNPRSLKQHRNAASGTPDGGRAAAPAARAACDSYSAGVRRLQCQRAAATVPAFEGLDKEIRNIGFRIILSVDQHLSIYLTNPTAAVLNYPDVATVDATSKTLHFNLSKRCRLTSTTGSSNQQLVTQSQPHSDNATTARRNTGATTIRRKLQYR